MRLRLLVLPPTILLLFLLPGPVAPASADPVVETVVEEITDLPEADAPRAETSEQIRTPIAFSMLAFTAPRRAQVSFRTSTDGHTWSDWVEAEPPEDKGPDDGTAEALHAEPDHRRSGEPMWVGEASFLQVRVDGAALEDVDVDLIDSMGLSVSLWRRAGAAVRHAWRGGGAEATAAGQPAIVTRAGWGADESLRNGNPAYATRARYAVLHHTAGVNEYSRAQAPGIVRGVYAYHTKSRGWSDIGYNFLVDRFGTIYEGRRGGRDKAVIGAHALGFNTGGIGVSMMGNHDSAAVSNATRDAVARLLAWKFAVHGINPAGSVSVTSACSGGSCKYPNGRQIRLPTLFGHRDVGYTSCPGARGHALLPDLRSAIAAVPVAVPYTPPFSDDDNSPHAAAIADLYERGITKGCTLTRFCPARDVSREQMASFLTRTMIHVTVPLPTPSRDWFTDTAGSVHEQAINILAEGGVSAGCGAGRFCPKEAVRRGDVAEWMANAFKLEPTGVDHFSDDNGTPYEWAINALADAGLTTGCAPDRYCDGAATTRGQMASFLSRAISRMKATGILTMSRADARP
jgi:hypothetical protein